MSRVLALAQLGCGYWGPNLLRAFQESDGCRVKWLCDPLPGRLEWARRRWPGLRLARDHRAALADPEVDAVAVATPVVTHYALARAALEAGKHAFVEKPLAHGWAQARRLALLARRRRLTLGVGHVFLYHPALRRMQEELDSGRVGRLCYLDLARVNPGPPAPAHDVFWDMAPHDVAMALALAEAPPLSVRASGRRYLQRRLDEAGFLELAFPRGVLARVHVGWLSSRRIRRVEVYAERGALFFDDAEPREKLRVVLPGKDTRVGARGAQARALYYGPGRTRVPALAPVEPLRAECADFLEAVRRRRQPLSGPESGVRVVRVLEAAVRSAASGGRPVGLA